jgi:nucleoside-diphosphate-sugar epimerase
MTKAIVLGSTGFVGSNVIKYLISKNIQVLAIGRNDEKDYQIKNDLLYYLKLDIEEINLLPEILDRIGWQANKECIFYNFAWKGHSKLMEGTLEVQLKNSIQFANSLKVASKLGCGKFINAGSIEETFFDDYLKHWNKIKDFDLPLNINYAIAKIASRDLCKLLSYLEKIDYVHTRFSITLDYKLSINSYVANCFKKILQNESHDKPINIGLFDIIDVNDLSEAYYHLGIYGKNQSDYFIGTGRPFTLKQYFEIFNNYVNERKLQPQFSPLQKEFDTSLLKQDTGLDFSNSFNTLVNKIIPV